MSVSVSVNVNIHVGLAITHQSSLNEMYNTTWYPLQSERIIYGRRKVIIDGIYRRNHEDGKGMNVIVEELKLVRVQGRLSL